MTAHEIKFHCSAIGEIMSGVKKKWSVEDSLTCKRELIKIVRSIQFNREFSNNNKYTEKGIQQEEDGITLYSRVTKRIYKKNSQRYENEYFSGEFDLINSDETVDIKCSYSLNTFPHPLTDAPDDSYIYQGLGYMDLTGRRRHIIAYCLVNALSHQVTREKEKLYYNMGCPDIISKHHPRYIKECRAIEQNMIFDYDQFMRDNPNYDLECDKAEIDIPMEDRIVEFVIQWDEIKMAAIKSRIDECRNYMAEKLFSHQTKTA